MPESTVHPTPDMSSPPAWATETEEDEGCVTHARDVSAGRVTARLEQTFGADGTDRGVDVFLVWDNHYLGSLRSYA